MGVIEGSESPFEWDLIHDLSTLPEDENIIIEYLLHRVERGQIYTWVGALLLALNPDNAILNDQYNSLNIELTNISEVTQKDVAPNINAIASRAHYRLVQSLGKFCQVIIISGDSGTGKTFNANKALNFLAAVNDASSISSGTQSNRIRDTVRKITSACPLISAFSTATTEKNVKSSRHGQLVKLKYHNGVVCGAIIRSFLLERSRVTMGYDNFHIFYQILAGLSEMELESLHLFKHSAYNLINCNKKSEYIDFSTSFEETVEAMSDLEFSVQERTDIFQVLAVLLHLGNITFKQNFLGGCTVKTEDEASKRALQYISGISSLPESKLIQFLTTSLVSCNNDKKRTTEYYELHTTEMCYNRLHAIIRHIYDQLFQQLISRINKSLSSGFECNTWLGILDIFGFEIFTENKIEQLCINYANERLQLYFMQDYLDSTRSDMIEEGLIDFIEAKQTQVHKDRLAVIEGYLFPVLIDATQCSAQLNETTLRQRLLDQSTVRFLCLPQDNQTFIIQHYSNPVEYSFKNFVSKNIDKVPPELSMVFENSKNALLCSLKDSIKNETNQVNGKIYAKKCTTLAKIRYSLDMLIKELNKCDSHYVRCVKPCRLNELWMKDDFRKQLKCIGIFDALNLARCKYPIRINYQEFKQRYCFRKSVTDVTDTMSVCKFIAQEVLGWDTISKSIHFGTKLIFLTESTFFLLEHFRKKYRSLSARKIQIFWKNRLKNKYIYNNKKKLNLKNKLELNTFYLPESSSLESLNFIISSRNQATGKTNGISDVQNVTPKTMKLKHVLLNRDNLMESTSKTKKIKLNGKSNFRISKFKRNYDKDSIETINYEDCIFYYKNRIVSRQKLAEVSLNHNVKYKLC